MRSHELARTTHTPELRQLNELNARLETVLGTVVTARDLGISGAHVEPEPHRASALEWTSPPVVHDRLLPSAVLVNLTVDGPPDFPYVHGHFRVPPILGKDVQSVTMHTGALVELSRRFDLRHCWGA